MMQSFALYHKASRVYGVYALRKGTSVWTQGNTYDCMRDTNTYTLEASDFTWTMTITLLIAHGIKHGQEHQVSFSSPPRHMRRAGACDEMGLRKTKVKLLQIYKQLQ